jgi:hypothetical protein
VAFAAQVAASPARSAPKARRRFVIAEFLKGTADETLKKLVQPAGLVPAFVLLLLHLAFIYPAAQSQEKSVALRFANLSAGWQTALVAAVLLGLSYLLLTTASSTLDLLSGLRVPSSAVLRFLRRLQARQVAALAAAAAAAPDEQRPALRWRLAVAFPITEAGVEEQLLRPTALGNAFAATQTRVRERYGIELAALWAHAEKSTKVKDAPGLTVVKDERAGLELLGNLTLVFSLFTLEGLVFFLLEGQPREAALTLLALLPGYVSYRAAVGKARSWGTAVETVLDLHRDQLRNELGLAAPTSNALREERAMWERASRFFLPGSDLHGLEPFQVVGEPLAQVSGAAQLVSLHAFLDVLAEERAGTSVELAAREYLIALSTLDDAGADATAGVLVTDPHVQRIAPGPTVIQAEGATFTGWLVATGSGAALHWKLADFTARHAVLLRYRVPTLTLAASGGATVIVAPPEPSGFAVAAGGDGGVLELELRAASPLLLPPTLTRAGAELAGEPRGNYGYRWQLERPPAGAPPLWLAVPSLVLEEARRG